MHPNRPPSHGPYPNYDRPPGAPADPPTTHPNAPHPAPHPTHGGHHAPHGVHTHPGAEPGNGHAGVARQPQQPPTPGDFCPIGAAWIKPGQSGFYTNFVWKGPDFLLPHGSVINIFPNDRKQPASNQPDFLLSCKIPTAPATTAIARTPSAQQFMHGAGPTAPTHHPDPAHTPHPPHGDPNAAPHPAYTHGDPNAAPHPAYIHGDPHAVPHPAYTHGDPHGAPHHVHGDPHASGHPAHPHPDAHAVTHHPHPYGDPHAPSHPEHPYRSAPHVGPAHPGGPGTPYTEPPRGTHEPDFPAGPTPGLDAEPVTHSPAPSELPGNPIHDPAGTAADIAPPAPHGAPPPPPTIASAGAPPGPPAAPHNGAPPGPGSAPARAIRPGPSDEDLIPY